MLLLTRDRDTSVLATHLTPAPCKPLHLARAGPVVTRGGLRWPVAPAALQGQAADVVGHAHHWACPHSSPTLRRALWDRTGTLERRPPHRFWSHSQRRWRRSEPPSFPTISFPWKLLTLVIQSPPLWDISMAPRPGFPGQSSLQISCPTTVINSYTCQTTCSTCFSFQVQKCSRSPTHKGVPFQVYVLVAKLCPTLFDPRDCSLPGSSVHGIFQVRILEWVAISSSRGSSWPRDRTRVS